MIISYVYEQVLIGDEHRSKEGRARGLMDTWNARACTKILTRLRSNIDQRDVVVECLEELQQELRREPSSADLKLASELQGEIESGLQRFNLEPEYGLIIAIWKLLIDQLGFESCKILIWLDCGNRSLRELGIKIIKAVNPERQTEAIETLVTTLMKRTNEDAIYKLMATTLEEIDGKMVVEKLKPYFSKAGWQYADAVTICSKIADKTLADELANALERSTRQYYEHNSYKVQEFVAEYFSRIRSPIGVKPLLKTISLPNNINIPRTKVAKALAKLGKPALEEIKEFMQDRENRDALHHVLAALSMMDSEILKELPFDEALKVARTEPGRIIAENNLVMIAQKIGDPIVPFLKPLLKGERGDYQFAIKCLLAIGFTLDQILEENIFHKLLCWAYKGRMKDREHYDLQRLLCDRSRAELPGKKQIGQEYAIQWILSAGGFPTIWVENAQREGLDLISISASERIVLVVGCTTGIIKDDVNHLFAMTEDIEPIVEGYRIIPIIFTTKRLEQIPNVNDIHDLGIVLAGSDEVRKLLQLVEHGRPHKEIVQYILSLTGHVRWG